MDEIPLGFFLFDFLSAGKGQKNVKKKVFKNDQGMNNLSCEFEPNWSVAVSQCQFTDFYKISGIH